MDKFIVWTNNHKHLAVAPEGMSLFLSGDDDTEWIAHSIPCSLDDANEEAMRLINECNYSWVALENI